MKHEFTITEHYENNVYQGQLEKCTKCSYEHLCPKNVLCVHLEAHETGCEN